MLFQNRFINAASMGRRMLAMVCAAHLATVSFAAPPAIEWDASTTRLLQAGATYGRMHRASEHAVLCAFEKQARSWLMRSEDGLKTWSEPILVGAFEAGAAANPELCILQDGRALMFWNERPRQQGGKDAFTIRMSASADGGRTWLPRTKPVFIAGNAQQNACWEPAAVEMPDGEVRLFFAHELPGQQEIAMMTSRNAGETWSAAAQVSLRQGRRDGMPVPLVLADGELVFSIEDNGIAGQDRPHPPFRPTIVEPSTKARWMALRDAPPDSCNVAAPYLARLPSGETLLSVQTNEDEHPWHHMAVYVGDKDAHDFGGRTLPFGLPENTNGEWNSLFVPDDKHVIALSHTTIRGQRGLWCVTGTIVRPR